ncbi:MAG TPA: MAPEG family protein [Nodosilinea sp.]|nr:MAPEG family protein [Nodosilinea sp.]
MTQTAIFGPCLAMMLLTLAVWVYLYILRLGFIVSRGVDPQDLATPEKLAERLPLSTLNPSNNFKNLFELPVLFYGLCLYLFVTGQVDGGYVNAAWVFAGFRGLHSAVHCTINRVTLRFAFYLIAALALWAMVVRAALGYL